MQENGQISVTPQGPQTAVEGVGGREPLGGRVLAVQRARLVRLLDALAHQQSPIHVETDGEFLSLHPM